VAYWGYLRSCDLVTASHVIWQLLVEILVRITQGGWFFGSKNFHQRIALRQQICVACNRTLPSRVNVQPKSAACPITTQRACVHRTGPRSSAVTQRISFLYLRSWKPSAHAPCALKRNRPQAKSIPVAAEFLMQSVQRLADMASPPSICWPISAMARDRPEQHSIPG
jgi:hypothetical protein